MAPASLSNTKRAEAKQPRPRGAPSEPGYAVLSTAIGDVGVAWRGGHVTAIQLPEATRPAMVERLVAKAPGAVPAKPPAAIAASIDTLVKHLAGEPVSLAAIPLALDGMAPFRRAVYEAARTIDRGEVLSYGALAARAGSPGAARAVGRAMATNPFPIVVPCHRVVGANGKPGGFSAYRGLETKAELLAIEKRSAPVPPPFDRAAAVRALAKKDPALGNVMKKVGPCTLVVRPETETFAALAEAIVYQQLNGKAAKTIFDRVRSAVGAELVAENVARVPDETLRAAGLSANKLKAIRDLSARDLAGEIPRRAELDAMDDDEIVARLIPVRGIGRWTVEMLLMFRLGRPDVLPIDDYGVRSGFARAFGRPELPTPKELLEYGERWRPWRSVASWYMWRVLDSIEKTSAKA